MGLVANPHAPSSSTRRQSQNWRYHRVDSGSDRVRKDSDSARYTNGHPRTRYSHPAQAIAQSAPPLAAIASSVKVARSVVVIPKRVCAGATLSFTRWILYFIYFTCFSALLRSSAWWCGCLVSSRRATLPMSKSVFKEDKGSRLEVVKLLLRIALLSNW